MILRIPNNQVFSFCINTRPRMHKGDEILAVSILHYFVSIVGLRCGDSGISIYWGKL